jgi:hypothetical protein
MLNRVSRFFLSEYVFNTEVRRGPIVLCRSEKLTDMTYTGAPSSHIYAVDSNRVYLIVVVLHHTTICVLSFYLPAIKSYDAPILHHCSFCPLGKRKA